ncbi:MAG TPA: hypothetical protein VD713_06015 [Sphingomonadales bacterium]|nr:hypothetical protein [Sphingomonadales bacterium]
MRGDTAGWGLRLPALVYGGFSLLLIAFVSYVHLFHPINIYTYSRDVWHHLAVLNALMESPFDPANPHIPTGDTSRTFMPWFVLLAILGRALGLTAQTVLGLSASFTMVFLMSGSFLFARTYFKDPWAPLVMWVVFFGAWGLNLNYTGLHNFATQVFSIGYPFGIVLAAGFFAWWAALKWLEAVRPRALHVALVAALPAFMFAAHQLQAGFALGTLAMFAIFWGTAPLRRRMAILGTAFAGMGLSALWPYYNPFGILLEATSSGWEVTSSWNNPVLFIFFSSVAFFGLFGFYDQRLRRWRRELTVGAAAIFVGYVAGGLLGNEISHRFLFFLVFMLHLGLVHFLFALRDWAFEGPSHPFRNAAFFTVTAAMGWLFLLHVYYGVNIYLEYRRFAAGEYGLFVSRRISPVILENIETLKTMAAKGEVFIGEAESAYPVQAFGWKVVSIPRPFPPVPDMAERQAASRAFFDPATPDGERWAIIHTYNPSWIIYRQKFVDPGVAAALRTFGEETVLQDGLVVIKIDAGRNPAPEGETAP